MKKKRTRFWGKGNNTEITRRTENHQMCVRIVGYSKVYDWGYQEKTWRARSAENIKRRGWPSSVTRRDYRKLERLVKSNRRDSLTYITKTFNGHWEVPISKRTVQFHLYRHNYTRCVRKKKLVVREVNCRKCLSWCREKKRNLTVNGHWNKAIFSDESKIMIGHDSRVYIWR